MDVRLDSLLAILGMAAATYLTRASGLFLVSRIRLTPRLEAFLKAIPGAILASLVAPAVLTKGPADTLAGLATVAVAIRTKSLILAMLAGILSAVLLRRVL